jgi:putative hydrolase of the HAD superfamily
MGVIFENRDIIKSYLLPFLRKKGVTYSVKKIIHIYKKATLGDLSSKEFWKRMGLIEHYPVIEREYLERYRIDSDFYDVAIQLKSSFKLALISNDVKEWSEILRNKYNLNEFFKAIIISGEIGYRKPNVKIFQELLKNLSTNAQNCLLIDDSLQNLQSASNLGFKTIRFIRENEKINFCSEFEISSFKELKFVIQNMYL